MESCGADCGETLARMDPPAGTVIGVAQQCVFCGGRATGRGEHIDNNAWLRRFWDPQGPFTLEVNGEVRMSGPDGERREHRSPGLARLMLPAVCNSRDAGPNNCNGWLNREFDEPGLPVLEAAIAAMRPLDAAETMTFARWWTKRMLLAKHPKVREGHWKTDQHPWTPWPESWLPQLRTTGQFPLDLELWMWVQGAGSGGSLPNAAHIDLPRTVVNDGSDGGGSGQSASYAFRLPNGCMVGFQLVGHPLVDLRHPFEQAGLVTRLWPQPPGRLDLDKHVQLDERGFEQMSHLFRDAGGSVGLEPGRRYHSHTRFDGGPAIDLMACLFGTCDWDSPVDLTSLTG